MILIVAGVYVNYHTRNALQINQNSNSTVVVNNSTITEENNTITTPQPSISPTPNHTSYPLIELTPAPTSNLPDDCLIKYLETNRSYDKDANLTQIVLYIEVISDMSSRRTYVLYENNFFLKENDVAIATINNNVTSEGILVSEDIKQTSYITIKVSGNYTSSNYELAYENFPPILVNWKKL